MSVHSAEARRGNSTAQNPRPSPLFSPISTATTDSPRPAVFFAIRPSQRTASAPAAVKSRKTQHGTTSRPSRYEIGEKGGLVALLSFGFLDSL